MRLDGWKAESILREYDIAIDEDNAIGDGDTEPAGILIISWIFDNIERSNVDVQSTPSLGAHGLWRWARGNKEKFFTSLYPKVVASYTHSTLNCSATLLDTGLPKKNGKP